MSGAARVPGESSGDTLVKVDGLSRRFDVSSAWLNRVVRREPKRILTAVDDVSFAVRRGETYALVGESGSGKSTIAKMIVGLLAPSDGAVRIDGTDPANASAAALTAFRRRVQMIFQDPYASLNPRWRCARHRRRAGARVLARDGSGRRRAARRGAPRAGRAVGGGRREVPARVLRRPASAHRHRPRARLRAGADRLRRADLRARRLGAGAGAEPDAGSPEGSRADVSVHHPRSFGRALHGRHDRRALPRAAGSSRRRARASSASPPTPTPACCSTPPRASTASAASTPPTAARCPTRSTRRPACHYHPRCTYRVAGCDERYPPVRAVGPRTVRCFEAERVLGGSRENETSVPERPGHRLTCYMRAVPRCSTRGVRWCVREGRRRSETARCGARSRRAVVPPRPPRLGRARGM